LVLAGLGVDTDNDRDAVLNLDPQQIAENRVKVVSF